MSDFPPSSQEFPPEPSRQPDGPPSPDRQDFPGQGDTPMTAPDPAPETSDYTTPVGDEPPAMTAPNWEEPDQESSAEPVVVEPLEAPTGRRGQAADSRGATEVIYDEYGPAHEIDALMPEPPEYIAIDQPEGERRLAVERTAARLGPFLADAEHPPTATHLLDEGEGVQRTRDRDRVADQVPTGWLVARQVDVIPEVEGPWPVTVGAVPDRIPASEVVSAVVLLPDGRLVSLDNERPHQSAAPASWVLGEDPRIRALNAVDHVVNDSTWTNVRTDIQYRIVRSDALARALNRFIDELQLPDVLLDELFPDRPRPTSET